MPRRAVQLRRIIAVVATDAPLLPHQLNRLCKRVGLGIGRVGSYAAHGSGEIVVGFSTANVIPRRTRKMVYKMKILLDARLDPLYEAVMEATEEAILNSMCMAEAMIGRERPLRAGAAARRGAPLPPRHPRRLRPAAGEGAAPRAEGPRRAAPGICARAAPKNAHCLGQVW